MSHDFLFLVALVAALSSCSTVRITCAKKVNAYSVQEETCAIDVNRNGRKVFRDEGKNINAILTGMGKSTEDQPSLKQKKEDN